MRVICLQRVPFCVCPLQRTVALSPDPFFAATKLFVETLGGLQILHGCKPSSYASPIVIFFDTFLTIRQFDK